MGKETQPPFVYLLFAVLSLLEECVYFPQCFWNPPFRSPTNHAVLDASSGCNYARQYKKKALLARKKAKRLLAPFPNHTQKNTHKKK